ncbi:hypothetical protein [Rhodoferax bucti]|uniref:hypothetical protein n=1 Tax=Rhodoferax bucti TaxID=2576305 RepID=UPI001108F94A|nr:hypothetical protein [Rhodoferax bucti]
MKAWWLVQSARINALSLRERVFLFVSLLVVVLAIADVLWLTPAQAAYKLAQQRFTTQSAEVRRLRAELAAVPAPVDASVALQAEIAESQNRIENLRAQMALLAPDAASAQALEPVLVQFLRRSPGLRLVSSGTVAADADPSGVAPASVSGIQRRGLELKVAGSYGDLTRYVKSLEQALPRLRWGSMQLSADKQGTELTLRVYVLEVQP